MDNFVIPNPATSHFSNILLLVSNRSNRRFFPFFLMAVPNVSPSPQMFPHFLATPPFPVGFSSTFPSATRRPFRPRRAFREWRDYEEALKRKDLAGALRFLKSLETEQRPAVEPFGEATSPVAELTQSRFRELEMFGPQRDWEVLDTCLNADNMKLVGNAYKFLRDRGFLPNFGKCRNIGEF